MGIIKSLYQGLKPQPTVRGVLYWHRPADLVVSAVALTLLVLMTTYVRLETPPTWEVEIFRFINNWPDAIFWAIWPFMQYGVFVTIPVVSAIASYFRKYRLAILLLLGGVGIYFLARYIKIAVPRGRPEALLDSVQAREHFAPWSSGFTSGHTAVAATIATFAHYYLSKNWRLISTLTLAVVVVGRVYVGGHLPLDVVGGVCLGVAVASLINFIVGTPVSRRQRLALAKQDRPKHPGDIIRLALAALVFAGTSLLAFSGGISRLEEYAFRFINSLPQFLSTVLQFFMQAGALAFVPVASLAALIFSHRRLSVKIAVGGFSAWWLAKLAKALVSRDRPFYLLEGIVQRAQNSGILGFPSGHAAVAGLIATVAAPYLKKTWSRTLWLIAWVVAVSRIYVGAHLPLDVLAGLAMGWFLGSILNLIFGTPTKPWPKQALVATLKSAGLKVKSLRRLKVDARGSLPLLGRTSDGQQLFIKLVDNEHRNADLLYKAWRYFTLREVEDEAPFATAKHITEHEAYLASQAASTGLRTPAVLLAAPINSKASILVTDFIQGQILSEFRGRLDRKLLDKIWREIKKLHKNRIAHRDLRAANILIDKQRRPWIIDFNFAETAASDSRLAMDVVELLVSLSLLVRPTTAVASAVRVLGKQQVAGILPYLQPLALTTVTRKHMRAQPQRWDEISRAIERQTGVLPVSKVRIARLNYSGLIYLSVIALAIYVFLPRLGDLGGALDAFRHSDLKWVGVMVLASFFSYVASALVVLGSTHRPLPFGRVLGLQAVTTLFNRLTPKGLGGIAVTERFLEKSGLKRLEAISSVSLVYSAGILTHVLMLIATFLVVDPSFLKPPALTSEQLILIAVVGLLIVLGVALIPWFKVVIKRFWQEGLTSLKVAIRHPINFAQLFGGSAGVTLMYTIGLYAALESVGSVVPFGVVLLIYLAANALASTSPTPGGLGATEAALVAGLTLAGVPIAQATAGVLSFRLFTFWLPILPSFLVFRHYTWARLL